jgi:selenocysteine lyase/cysteine desulfurase
VIGEPGQGTLVSWVAADDPADTARRLYQRGVIVRDLPGTGLLRASCGWWSNEEDVERLVAALAP